VYVEECEQYRQIAAMRAMIMKMTYTWRELHMILMIVLMTKGNEGTSHDKPKKIRD
jgi:hypothetical protein